MFGYENKEEFLKLSITDLYENPEDRTEFHDVIVREGAVKRREVNLKRKDGTTFPASLSTVVIYDSNGEPAYYDGIVDDITQKK
jgi:PAS domain S-box-containing protein